MVAAESPSPRALDELDQALLRELRGNGRMAISELARRVGAAESTCHKRVGALVESGVITGFRAEVDPAALGLSIEVLISIRVHPHARRSLTRFQAYLTGICPSRGRSTSSPGTATSWSTRRCATPRPCALWSRTGSACARRSRPPTRA